MFPNGWPGWGLLLLRLVAGGLLIYGGIAGLMVSHSLQLVAQQCIVAGAGLLLLIGLWTPIAGVLIAITELWVAIAGTDHLHSAILLATLGAALAMLGPGNRSVDARLFGRKRIDIRDR